MSTLIINGNTLIGGEHGERKSFKAEIPEGKTALSEISKVLDSLEQGSLGGVGTQITVKGGSENKTNFYPDSYKVIDNETGLVSDYGAILPNLKLAHSHINTDDRKSEKKSFDSLMRDYRETGNKDYEREAAKLADQYNFDTTKEKNENNRFFLVEIQSKLGNFSMNEVELYEADSFKSLDMEAIAKDYFNLDEGELFSDLWNEDIRGWEDKNGAVVKYPSVVSELTRDEAIKWEEAMAFKKMNRPVLLQNEGEFYYVDVRDDSGEIQRKIFSESDSYIENKYVRKDEVLAFGVAKEDAEGFLNDRIKIPDQNGQVMMPGVSLDDMPEMQTLPDNNMSFEQWSKNIDERMDIDTYKAIVEKIGERRLRQYYEADHSWLDVVSAVPSKVSEGLNDDVSKIDISDLLEDSKRKTSGLEVVSIHRGYIEDKFLSEKFEFINYTNELRSIPSRQTVAFNEGGEWVINPYADTVLLIDNDKYRLSQVIKDNSRMAGDDLAESLNSALKDQKARNEALDSTVVVEHGGR